MNSRLLGIGAVALAFGLGAATGHILTKRRLEVDFQKKLDEELEASRKYNLRLSKRGKYSDPVPLSEEVNKKVEDDEGPVITMRRDRMWDFDYETEVPKRDPEIPYVIAYEEFMENNMEYEQSTMTYFSQDDVLVDERDTPIENINLTSLIGPNSLEQFGNGSRDPNIVYVRNDRISMAFEIVYDPGSFEETVVGHIKHSESHKIRKFRIDDD